VERTKPFGIALVAICSALFGLVCLPVGCTATFVSQVPGASLFFSFAGMVVALFGVLLLSAAYGLWTLQEWGRSLTFWLCAISIPLGLISIFPVWPGQQMTAGNTFVQLVGAAVNAAIVYYLMTPHVRALFGGTATRDHQSNEERREPRL
jgi:Predicted membrane protein (DUF2127)